MPSRKLTPLQRARLEALADRVDVFTEQDLALLTGTTLVTLSDWRSRGQGPAYVRAGAAFVYPRKAVAAWLESRVRERGVDTKAQL